MKVHYRLRNNKKMRYSIMAETVSNYQCNGILTSCIVGMMAYSGGISTAITIHPSARKIRDAGVGEGNRGIDTGAVRGGKCRGQVIYIYITGHREAIHASLGISNGKFYRIGTGCSIKMGRIRQRGYGTAITKSPLISKWAGTGWRAGKDHTPGMMADMPGAGRETRNRRC